MNMKNILIATATIALLSGCAQFKSAKKPTKPVVKAKSVAAKKVAAKPKKITPQALANGTWKIAAVSQRPINQFNSGKTIGKFAIRGDKARIDAGCNSISFTLKLKDKNEASLNSIISTRAVCKNNTLEPAILRQLMKINGYVVSNRNLKLLTIDRAKNSGTVLIDLVR